MDPIRSKWGRSCRFNFLAKPGPEANTQGKEKGAARRPAAPRLRVRSEYELSTKFEVTRILS